MFFRFRTKTVVGQDQLLLPSLGCLFLLYYLKIIRLLKIKNMVTNGLFTTLFNRVLEAAIRRIHVSVHIGMKTTQVFAYADYIAIISRNRRGLEENLLILDSEGHKRGLRTVSYTHLDVYKRQT